MSESNSQDSQVQSRRRPGGIWILAITLPIFVLLIGRSLPPSVGERPFPILFVLPVVIVGVRGGLAPGLLTTLVTAVVGGLYLAATGSPEMATGSDLLQWAVLLISGVLTSALSEGLHRARRKEADRSGQLVSTESRGYEDLTMRYAAIVESTDDAVIGKDLNGKVTAWNRGAEAMFGYSEQEAMGKSLVQLIIPDELAAEERSILDRICSGNTLRHYETVRRRKDGTRVEVSVTVSPLRNSRGEILGAAKIARDITERTKLEQEISHYRSNLEDLVEERTAELQQAHKRLFEMTDAVSRAGISVFWVDNTSARLLDVNERACEMTGYQRDEMLRLSVPDIDPNCPKGNFAATLARLRDERRTTFETVFKHRDGHLIPVEVTLYYPDSAYQGADIHLTFTTDISLRKQAEQALIDAKHLAESANRAKSAFLANMSHEIRTPLNAISGMAHLIRRAGLDPKQMERFDKLEAASRHLLTLINDILDLSKIEAGKLVLEEVPIDIEEVVANVIAMMSSKAQDKHLALDSVIEPRLAQFPLLGDRTRLQQALLNYGNNAIKFTERGRITVRISVLDEDDATALLLFEVIDTGVGIEPDSIDRLFNEFEQADNTITRKYGGTGLGLAITRRLALLMGGEVGIESRPGTGSSFWFTARLRKGTSAWFGKSGVPGKNPEAVLRREFAGIRILLAEDEPINREVAKSMLEVFPCVVDEAEDGLEALDQASRKAYDLILMDLQMPLMGGLEAAERIRLLPLHARTPIFAMTANTFKEDEEKCSAAGMNGFISKPVPPEELYATLVRALENTSCQERAATAASPTNLVGYAEISQAIETHRLWVARFKSAIEGINIKGFDVSRAGDFNRCEFGLWLDSASTRERLGESVHAQLEELHRNFHDLAGKVAACLNRGETGESMQLLLDRVDDISGRFVRGLKAIQFQSDVAAED